MPRVIPVKRLDVLEETVKTLKEATFDQPCESKRRKVDTCDNNACNNKRDKTSKDTCNNNTSENSNKKNATANNDKKRKFMAPSFVLRNDEQDDRKRAGRKTHCDPLQSFAASAATEEEERKAKELQQSGQKPVELPKRIWRPQMQNTCVEPDDNLIPDSAEGLDTLFSEHGHTVRKTKGEDTPERQDTIKHDPETDKAELEGNAQWRDCPEEHRPEVLKAIVDCWDVFAKRGMKRPIIGCKFHVDTGDVAPISCSTPRHGPHESRAIDILVKNLEDGGIIEDDDGPWGAMTVLATKPNQEHVHWSEHVFRFCVSCRNLNSKTRPFTFPTPRCDDAILEIGNAKFFITMDLDCGCWQAELTDASKGKTAFFVPAGKKRFARMPMGTSDAHPFFVAMMQKFKIKWEALAKERKVKGCGSKITVDDVLLHGLEVDQLIAYFRCVLEVLQQHRATVKLRKCRFFPATAEFVGHELSKDGNRPSSSKFEAFEKMTKPKTFTDLRMIIGFIGFCQTSLPLCEEQIAHWREMLTSAPKKADESLSSMVGDLWTTEDDRTLEDLKQQMLNGPVLQRPNFDRRFCLKTDWSKHGMGAVLLQADDSDETRKAEDEEEKGGPCMFDCNITGLRLRPVLFLSHRINPKSRETGLHSYAGEAKAGVWAIEKLRCFLFGKEFTWITDCSGLKTFMETEDVPTHQLQRWRLQLLRHCFATAHRPNRMMTDVDTLSRHNAMTDEWRRKAANKTGGEQQEEQPKHAETSAMCSTFSFFATPAEEVPYGNCRPTASSAMATRRTALAQAIDQERFIWNAGAGASATETAINELGTDCIVTEAIEDDEFWKSTDPNCSTAKEVLTKSQRATEHHIVDWLIANDNGCSPRHAWDQATERRAFDLVLTAKEHHQLQAAIIFVHSPDLPQIPSRVADTCKFVDKETKDWDVKHFPIRNSTVGGQTDSSFTAMIIAPPEVLGHFCRDQSVRAGCISDILDPAQGIFDDCIWPSDVHLHCHSDTNYQPAKDGEGDIKQPSNQAGSNCQTRQLAHL